MRRQNPLQRGIQALGRLGTTEHILRVADDEAMRRRMLVGLIRGERVQNPAQTVMFGRQGRFGDRAYLARLTRASALRLVLNAIAVWNTRYLDAAARRPAQRGRPVPDEAWRRLSPLLWEHVHLIGRYDFSEPVIAGE